MGNEGKGYIEHVTRPGEGGRPDYFHMWVEQLCPIVMNRGQLVTTGGASVDFIPSNDNLGLPVGLGLMQDVLRLETATLLILGKAVNVSAVENYLDCGIATDNQWVMNINGGGYVNLQNGLKNDGQMNDEDWRCFAEGSVFYFELGYDISNNVGSLTDLIGLRLQNARSIADSLQVYVDVYLKLLWRN